MPLRVTQVQVRGPAGNKELTIEFNEHCNIILNSLTARDGNAEAPSYHGAHRFSIDFQIDEINPNPGDVNEAIILNIVMQTGSNGMEIDPYISVANWNLIKSVYAELPNYEDDDDDDDDEDEDGEDDENGMGQGGGSGGGGTRVSTPSVRPRSGSTGSGVAENYLGMNGGGIRANSQLAGGKIKGGIIKGGRFNGGKITSRLSGGRRRISKAPCKKSKSKSKSRGRKSPPYEAFKCEGRIKKGLDGNMWIAKESKNGVIRWVPKK
jgi:hypothetical protein